MKSSSALSLMSKDLLPVHTLLLFIVSLRFDCSRLFTVEETVIAMAKTVRRSLKHKHCLSSLEKKHARTLALQSHFNAFNVIFPTKPTTWHLHLRSKTQKVPPSNPLTSVELSMEVSACLQSGSSVTLQLQFQGACS